jgi:hypothetical protein
MCYALGTQLHKNMLKQFFFAACLQLGESVAHISTLLQLEYVSILALFKICIRFV